mmetsp:Transcript_39512/g.60312  ORF Transcript_39512/g.60312 Transcript_39512/m.60312 type:complete len:121 (+) Transcript_39512:328-690(+)
MIPPGSGVPSVGLLIDPLTKKLSGGMLIHLIDEVGTNSQFTFTTMNSIAHVSVSLTVDYQNTTEVISDDTPLEIIVFVRTMNRGGMGARMKIINLNTGALVAECSIVNMFLHDRKGLKPT